MDRNTGNWWNVVTGVWTTPVLIKQVKQLRGTWCFMNLTDVRWSNGVFSEIWGVLLAEGGTCDKWGPTSAATLAMRQRSRRRGDSPPHWEKARPGRHMTTERADWTWVQSIQWAQWAATWIPLTGSVQGGKWGGVGAGKKSWTCYQKAQLHLISFPVAALLSETLATFG